MSRTLSPPTGPRGEEECLEWPAGRWFAAMGSAASASHSRAGNVLLRAAVCPAMISMLGAVAGRFLHFLFCFAVHSLSFERLGQGGVGRRVLGGEFDRLAQRRNRIVHFSLVKQDFAERKVRGLVSGINLNRLAEGGGSLLHVAGLQIHGAKIISGGKIGAISLQRALQVIHAVGVIAGAGVRQSEIKIHQRVVGAELKNAAKLAD